MNNASLIKLQHFFEVDNKIKKEMYNNVPSNEYIDNDSICKYTNELDDSLNYIFSELKCITYDFFGDSFELHNVLSLEKRIKEEFYSCNLDINKLRDFYKKYISNMNESFVNEVKANCKGYVVLREPKQIVASSINEMLHLVHAKITNNDHFLQSITPLAGKENDYGYKVIIRGNSTNTFNKLFLEFPNSLDVGDTDMIALNDKKMLMMVRDRGHALTMEVSINDDKARIEYFIPKICNIDMVNALPGINPVNKDSIGATGVMEINKEELNNSLFTFISKVPTDSDVIRDENEFASFGI